MLSDVYCLSQIAQVYLVYIRALVERCLGSQRGWEHLTPRGPEAQWGHLSSSSGDSPHRWADLGTQAKVSNSMSKPKFWLLERS